MTDRPTIMDEFLKVAHLSCLGTLNPDGSIHMVPVTPLFDAENGTFFISTGAESVTYRNLKKNPTVTLCVDDYKFPYRAVIVQGKAEVTEPLGLDHEGIKRVVDHSSGPGMWENFYMNTPPAARIRVRITVIPEKWSWWDNRRKIKGSKRIAPSR